MESLENITFWDGGGGVKSSALDTFLRDYETSPVVMSTRQSVNEYKVSVHQATIIKCLIRDHSLSGSFLCLGVIG